MACRLHAVSAIPASRPVPIDQVEQRVAEASSIGIPRGVVGRLTGVHQVFHADDDTQASDLAVSAARQSLAASGSDRVDLLIFASASQDVAEPATSHIVAAKLGLSCPVFDVRNACNSWLNGVQVAEALIESGQYRRVLVVTGEMPSRAMRWQVRDLAQYASSFPGWSMSDAGAAGVVERCDPDDSGAILHRWFTAESQHWAVGLVPGCGSMHPRDPDRTYFEIDGARLRAAFDSVPLDRIHAALARDGFAAGDFATVAAHQVAMRYLDEMAERLGLKRHGIVETLPTYGNCTSASIPLQLQQIREQELTRPGEPVLLLGLGGGISLGTMVVRA